MALDKRTIVSLCEEQCMWDEDRHLTFIKALLNAKEEDVLTKINEIESQQINFSKKEIDDLHNLKMIFDSSFKDVKTKKKNYSALNEVLATCDEINNRIESKRDEFFRLMLQKDELNRFIQKYCGFDVEKLIRKVKDFIIDNLDMIAELPYRDTETTESVLDFCLAIGPAVANEFGGLGDAAIIAILIVLCKRGFRKEIKNNSNN